MANHDTRRLFTAIDALIEKHGNEGDQGRVEIGACSVVEDDLTDWLAAEAIARDYRREARTLLERYRKARKPKRQPGQGVLFDPCVMYPQGDSSVIPATKITRPGLIRYQQVRQEAFFIDADDYAEDMRYITSRLMRFQSDEELLIEIEKRYFGWSWKGDVGGETE